MEKILSFAKETREAKNSGQSSLFESLDSSTSSHEINKLQLQDAKPASRTEKMAWEKELLGLYVSDHPLKEYSSYLRDNFPSIKSFNGESVNQIIKIGGIITKIQKIITRSGQAMVFATLEDLTGKIEILVFPRLLSDNQEIWVEGNIVCVKGKLSDKDGVFKLLAEEIRKINLNDAEKYSEKHNSDRVDEDEKSSKFICITVPQKGSQIALKKLSEFLNSADSGEYSVYISVPSSDASYKKIKTSKKIAYSEKVFQYLAEIVGNGNIKI